MADAFHIFPWSVQTNRRVVPVIQGILQSACS